MGVDKMDCEMRKVDIRGGQMTFGQRIELGRILTDTTTTEAAKMIAVMRCLDPKWKTVEMPRSIDYFAEVIEGLTYWVKREASELKYEPTEEERSAGIGQLSKLTGEMGTIMALAKDYGKDPDEVLGWKYGKVFNILYTNLQSHLFQERLMKVRERRAREKSGKPWGAR